MLFGERVVFSLHAIKRMFERRGNEQDVYAVARTGEVIEVYPDDTPYPSRLLLGWVGGRPLHLVLADNVREDKAIVVTIYEPDDMLWPPGFRRRRS